MARCPPSTAPRLLVSALVLKHTGGAGTGLTVEEARVDYDPAHDEGDESACASERLAETRSTWVASRRPSSSCAASEGQLRGTLSGKAACELCKRRSTSGHLSLAWVGGCCRAEREGGAPDSADRLGSRIYEGKLGGDVLQLVEPYPLTRSTQDWLWLPTRFSSEYSSSKLTFGLAALSLSSRVHQTVLVDRG